MALTPEPADDGWQASPPPGLGRGGFVPHYGDARHWRRLAHAASEQGETALAISYWDHVRRLDADARDADFHIACAHALAGRRERAAVAFADLAADPHAPPELRRRALRLAQLVGVDRW